MALTPGKIYQLNNFAETTLAQELSVSALSMIVASATKFPTLTTNQAFRLTLYDGSQDPEIVEVTAESSETFTITRAQENTIAKVWAAGTLVRLAPTAELLQLMAANPSNGIQWYPRDVTEIVSVASGYGAFGVGTRFAADVDVANDAMLAIAHEMTMATGDTLTVATGGTTVVL